MDSYDLNSHTMAHTTNSASAELVQITMIHFAE
jgi:hypothetical protein